MQFRGTDWPQDSRLAVGRNPERCTLSSLQCVKLVRTAIVPPLSGVADGCSARSDSLKRCSIREDRSATRLQLVPPLLRDSLLYLRRISHASINHRMERTCQDMRPKTAPPSGRISQRERRVMTAQWADPWRSWRAAGCARSHAVFRRASSPSRGRRRRPPCWRRGRRGGWSSPTRCRTRRRA